MRTFNLPAQAPAPEELSDVDLVATVQSSPPGTEDRDRACAELVRRYDGLVRRTARRYLNTPESQEELIQSGYVGLLKAINNYDQALGFDLAAYARPCISGEIKRHFRDKRWAIHVRRGAQELRAQLVAARGELMQLQSRQPTEKELADYLGISAAELLDAQRADIAFTALSLDAPVSGDAGASDLAHTLGQEDAEIETGVNMDAVWAHMQELPEREQELLTMRFYGEMTQAQIGAALGISQMHVSRLLARALRYLRWQLLSDDA